MDGKEKCLILRRIVAIIGTKKMNVLENFKDLFIEIWQLGIAGVNLPIGLAIAIFLFLLLRGLIAKFILQRLKNYVAKIQ